MPRRGDPEKIYQAQRAGIFRRLVGAERLDDPDAEHSIARWEREAEATGRERGSLGYWDEGWQWIEAQRSRPKTTMDAEGGLPLRICSDDIEHPCYPDHPAAVSATALAL